MPRRVFCTGITQIVPVSIYEYSIILTTKTHCACNRQALPNGLTAGVLVEVLNENPVFGVPNPKPTKHTAYI